MSPRLRVALLVALASVVGAGLAVAGAVATREDRGGARPRKGFPPLVLDLGLRTDPDAARLRQANAFYVDKQYAKASRIFERSDDPQGRIGAALARWPNGSLADLEGLGEERPRDPVVLLNLGIARIWTGDDGGGVSALRRVRQVAPDTLSAVRADDLMHPEIAPNLPTFVPSFSFPREIERLPAPRQFAELERRARGGGVRDKLLYGVVLQRLGRRLSAERVYAQAARIAPNDPEAQVAAAVGRFDKEAPSRAFSRLGPLTRRFPQAATVRFHLGLLLLWIGQLDPAKRQLRQAIAEEHGSPIAREARRFLDRLGDVRQ